MSVPDCGDCVWFPYSNSRNDRGRYVRNTNALMGMAFAWVSRATEDTSATETIRGVLRAEHRETMRHNLGYYGSDDPRFRADPAKEAALIDNHVPYVAKALLDMGRLVGDTNAVSEGVAMMHAWASCDPSRCRSSNNVAFAPCFFRRMDTGLARTCQEVRAASGRLSNYQRWAVSD